MQGGLIENYGGGGNPSNGGTLKVFYVVYQAGVYSSGRVLTKQYGLPETGTIFEF
jgi:hypothetical protein